MADTTQKLSFVEKAGFSLGDASANFVFQTLIAFQAFFYTEAFGLTAAAAGTILLVGRLWDAFFDPLMGYLADRTNTRWGKFRPWILWTALPWGVVMVLAYTRPNFEYTGMLIYACVTNTLLMTLYSANNTPYSALMGVMTGDGTERTKLSSYRFVAAMLAGLAVGGFTLPLVKRLPQVAERYLGVRDAQGWQLTMGLWAILSVVFFLITFLTTRERIQPAPKQKVSAKLDFGNLLRNGPWIAMFIFTLAHFAVLAMRGGSLAYYFKYCVDRQQVFEFLQGLHLTANADGSIPGGIWYYLLDTFGMIVDPRITDLQQSNVADVGYSVLRMSTQVVTLIGVLCSTWLCMRFGKKAVALVGFSLATVVVGTFFLVPTNSVWMIYAWEWAQAVCYSPTIPVLWAMFADVADYSEWKTGRRATGIIFAGIIFALKAGLSLGGAISGWLLNAFGYVANVAQKDSALLGIRLNVSIFPATLFLICVVCLLCYKIGRAQNQQIQDELAERRKTFAAEQ